MKYENIFVQFPHLDYNNFSRKTVELFLNMIDGTRLSADMTFEGYGKIGFGDDDRKQSAIIDLCFDDFKMRNVSALVFDISKSERNSTDFDKVVFFTQTCKKTVYIHYLFFDSETGKSCAHFYRANDLMYLLQDLNMSFNRMKNSKRIIEYGKLGDRLERHPGTDLHIITNGLYGI
jgi:hypothetical protein